MSPAPKGPVEIAREHWGAPAPDWVEALARECAGSTQRKVAERLGRSAGLISQVLRQTYKGDMAGVEDAVRGAFMGQTVDCPALGLIPTDACQIWRKRSRDFASVNPLRVRMFRACAACPRNQTQKES